MQIFEIIALLTTLAALFSYLNHRFIRLPTTIGLMLISLLMSLSLIVGHYLGIHLESSAERIVTQIDFSHTLLQGMLSFLLFAGALHVNLDDLLAQKWAIGIFATLGLLCSTALVGGAMFVLLNAIGLPTPLLACLVFGALISPTDPIAVLGLLKQANVPKSLETNITGESLFNDGIGVVIFLVLLEMLTGEHHFDVRHIGQLLLQEAFGGAILGLALGWFTYHLLKTIDNYQVEVLLTLALVTGGYALASALHMSGPLAIVAAGLLIGNRGRTLGMSDTTREHLDTFWELIDEILNAILFVLIGLEVLIVPLQTNYLMAAALAIPVVLCARFLSIGLPVSLARARRPLAKNTTTILTWAGLRGGISVALVLALPAGPERALFLTSTYAVVVFSIIVQGLTLPALLRRTMADQLQTSTACPDVENNTSLT